MVVPLGPGKFYGTSLPRPRFYTDVKFSDERVDPPVPVMDPLLSWASEAHWSMGGLSFKRLRLQGRIEGSITKLRSRPSAAPSPDLDSPPPAPVATKRRRFMDEIEEDMERKGGVAQRRRRLVKKLGDDFDRVAAETGDKSENEAGSGRTRRQILEDEDDVVAVTEKANKVVKSKGEKVNSGGESGAVKLRSSPRLAHRS